MTEPVADTAASDPWAAFNPQPADTATTGAADPWAAFNPEPAPADPAVPPEIAPSGSAEFGFVPPSFIERLERGQALRRVLNRVAEKAREGFGEPTATGLSDETLNGLIEAGIFHDPTRSRPGPIQFANEALILPTARALDVVLRSLNAGIHGAGGLVGQLVEESGGSQGQGARAEREAINFGNWAMIEAGFGGFSRPAASAGRVADQPIGGLPREADFRNAADVLGKPEAGQRLQQVWREDGIHPSEALHDAQRDAFIRHDLTTKADEVKPTKEFVENWPEPVPQSLGAAVNTEPPLIPLAEQPAAPPGRLAATFRDAGEKLLDMGRDAQMLVAPMATGTRDSMAMAKDFANSLRRNRWEWSRIDDDIAKRFTPEQRTRMWNAADEESVARQLGESREHQGLITLEPAERAAVEDLQTRAQMAWVRARDLGMVEGEGLPAYTPRMVMNVGSALDGDGPIALNGIGHNLHTRTAQMKRRDYLTAEETERAAKELVGMREAKKGKSLEQIQAAVDKVEIARDIRVLPLATAKLEDAIAGRTLINNIKDYGARTGIDTVAEGAIPAGSETQWFTLDHPAFKTWRPKLQDAGDGKWVAVKDAAGNPIFEQVPLYVHGDFEGPLKAVLSHGPVSKIYAGAMDLKGKTMSLIMNSPLIHNAVEWGRALPAMPGKVGSFKIYFEGYRAKNNPALMREAIDAGLVPIGKRFFNQDVTSIMEAPDLTPGRSWTAKILATVPGLFDEAAGVAVKRAIDKAGDFWHNTMLWDRIADLQMGLYSNFRDDMIAKGVDRLTANRVAAHFANRYAGALPQEAMSDAARKMANLLMFSRTFTLGNLGAMKDVLTGLPKDVLAQIERDAGLKAGAIDQAGRAAGPQVEAVQFAKSMARRKAMAVMALDIGLFYVGNSLLQNGLNIILNDSTVAQEIHDYARRALSALERVKEHPLTLLQPLGLLESLSATDDNEPKRKDRIMVGFTKDGTAIYARNPAGKIGEEMLGYMTGPLDMMRRKMSTFARPAWQILANDKGFGRKIYDPDAHTPMQYAQNVGRIAAHIALAQTPEGQINAFADLVRGEGDAKLNALQAFGPVAGFTFSKGAPGGPAAGELYAARSQHQFSVDLALPEIRRQILRGDEQGALDRMTSLGMPPPYQRFIIRTTRNPSLRVSPRALRGFHFYATPEQAERMERARERLQ